MKPLKLTLSAFGPFANEQSIDFTQVTHQGIYLITGDTGAGKTTIFDGISYALFGDTSGGKRDASMMRCELAGGQQKTYVSLTFSYHDKIYIVQRNPEYRRPKTRGVGETFEKADAELVFQNGETPVFGVKQVNEKIHEILGITKEQFLQIAMIAQGDFMDLLLANTKTRMDIFRKIFNTGYFQIIQDKLKEQASKLNHSYLQIKVQVINECNKLMCENDSAYFENITKLKLDKEYISSETLLNLIANVVAETSLHYEETLEQRNYMQKEIDESREFLTKSIAIKSMQSDVEKKDKELQQKQKKYKLAEQCLENLDEKKEEIEQLQQKLYILQNAMNDYEDLQKLVIGNNKRQQDKLNFEKLYEQNKKQLVALQQQKKQITSEIEALGNPEIELEKLNSNIGQIEQEALVNDRFIKIYLDVLSIQKQFVESFAIFHKKEQEFVLMDQKFRMERTKFMGAQAGILAKQLVENTPCPVCGSLSHPTPCVAEYGKLEIHSNEELKKYESMISAKKDECDMQKLSYEKLITERNAKIQEITSDTVKVDFDEKMQNSLGLKFQEVQIKQDFLNDEKKSLLGKIEQYKKNYNTLENLQNDVISLQKNIEKIEKDKNTCELQIGCLTTEISTIKKQEEDIKKKLLYNNQQEAEDECLRLDKVIKTFVKNYDEKQTEKNELGTECNSLQSSISTLKDQLKDEPLLVEEELIRRQNNLKQAELQKSSVDKKVQENFSMKQQNSQILNQVRSLLCQLDEVNNEMVICKDLADVANGNTSGKTRIMLEVYVQMWYFDQVLERANLHLLKMTNGRYELLRKQDGFNKQSQSGLELDVCDHFYMLEESSIRSVKTLSGGESFLAALSLALGMSEQISENSGGIKLDAMFVDEGFGTLDDEALNRAMKALNELSTANQTIGIISHVDELKKRIDQQIIVTKDKAKGSHIETVGI